MPLPQLYRVVAGDRACRYLPEPGVPPHYFRSEALPTLDGAFIVDQYYNRGISELAIVGYDLANRRFIRTTLSKAGVADVAVSSGQRNGAWAWRSIMGTTDPRTVTLITPHGDSYGFRSTNDRGYGFCK